MTFIIIVLAVVVIGLLIWNNILSDRLGTFEVELNFFIRDLNALEGRVDNMNKETIRILAEKVAELEEKVDE